MLKVFGTTDLMDRCPQTTRSHLVFGEGALERQHTDSQTSRGTVGGDAELSAMGPQPTRCVPRSVHLEAS